MRGARKLGGVLAEGRTDGGRLTHVVVGFGVNVRSSAFPPEISARATSLEDELGRDVDRGAVLAAMLRRFSTWLARLRAQTLRRRRGAMVGARRGRHRGRRWSGRPMAAQRRGVTAGIDGDGALLIRAGTSTERVVAGEVIWL